MKFTPRPYQDLAADHMLNVPRCALFAKPGMGKTSTAAHVIDCLYLAGESAPTIILAPKRVARYTWPNEFKKWDDFKGYDVVPIIGTEQQRLAALKRDAPIFTTNYEQLPWLIDHFGSKWPFATIIPDESTKVKNVRVSVRSKKTGSYIHPEKGGSGRALALSTVAFLPQVKRFIELTGTPASNGLKDLWGQLFFLDMGYRLGRCYGAFEERWFERVMRHRNDKYGELRPRFGAEAEINAKIADLCLALDPKDWFPDLKEPLRFTVTVDLPAKARALYKQMEKEMYIEIRDQGVEAFTASAMTMKCRQMAAGFVWVDREQEIWEQIHDEKIQALEEIYEECGGVPLLVAYQFVPDMLRLMRELKGAVDLATDEGLRAFMAGEAAYGLGQPASIGFGFDGMQDITNVIVFFSSDFNLEYREQIIERIGPMRQLQSGHQRKVLIYDIVAADTIDEVVLDRLARKCTVQEALFDAMKKKSFA